MSAQTINDRYAVTERLGAGGGGTVWRATDEVLARTVAVKEVELPAHLPAADRERVRTRALREATSTARVHHRSVVSIYDVIDSEGALYIVMEHIDAPSLARVVADEGPLPVDTVVSIGLDVLDGLSAAHAAGIVHRDIKPSNILVPSDAPAVVTDFGIAAVRDESGLTPSGEALGTPDYISPEQVEAKGVGPRCDLWSLGATLYFAVEGVPPFHRDRAVLTVHAVVSADPRPTERAGPLGPVIERLLVKDPDERPDLDTTRELLQRVLDGAAVTRAIPVAGSGVGTANADDPATAPHDTTGDDATGPETRPPVPAPPDPSTAVPLPPPGSGPPTAAAPEGEVEVEHVDPGPGVAARLLGVLVAVGLVVAIVVLLWPDADRADAPLTAGESETTSLADGAGEEAASDDGAVEDGAGEDGAGEDGAVGDAGASSADEVAPPADEETVEPGSEPETTSENEPVSPSERPAEPGTVALPEGWVRFDGGDYSVGVPGDWTERDAPGSAMDLVAPSGDVYLRSGDTDDPAEDVLADTTRLRDDFASRYGSYEEISLEEVEYRGFEAVLWEYTYVPQDRRLHAVHLNFSDGDHAYVLNYQTPDAEWGELGDRFDLFRTTFEER